MTVASDRSRLRDYLPHCGWPALYYGVVTGLARSIKATDIIEIGVAYGYHAIELLNGLPHCAYHGVDPYTADYDKDDSFTADVAALFGETVRQAAFDRLFAAVSEELSARAAGRVKLHRLPSVAAALTFADSCADLIFIDGDHRYASAKADLAAWWPKLRTGGIFCGDDYSWPDVRRAVDEFAASMGRSLQIVGKLNTNYPIWVIQK